MAAPCGGNSQEVAMEQSVSRWHRPQTARCPLVAWTKAVMHRQGTTSERTLTLQDTLLRRTAPTSAALPVQFLLTRPRASPWRALTMWVGTHELLQLSDSTSQQLAVRFTCSSSHLHHLNPPHRPPQWSGSGLERLVVFSTVQHCLTLSSPDLTAANEQS